MKCKSCGRELNGNRGKRTCDGCGRGLPVYEGVIPLAEYTAILKMLEATTGMTRFTSGTCVINPYFKV